jgi:hypothetical protein
MPLIHSASRDAISQNIRRELGANKPQKQAVAIALDTARRSRAMGGPPPAPWFTRNEARGMLHTGPIVSAVPGRTDRHNMAVPSGAYVIPSETVSHLGQNNTMAGLSVLNHLFGQSGPYGVGRNMAVRGKGRADGGSVGAPVDIVTAGGEFVIPPEIVASVGGGDVDHGHKILDAWVMQMRKDHIKTLRKLAPPAKD